MVNFDMNITSLKFQRFLAMLYAGASLGIVYFWWRFFQGELFIIEDIRTLIPNFQGYYDWEKSFVVPDVLLAITMMCSAILLWFDLCAERGRLLASACAGACLFLGVLDLSYGFSSGLYQIDHPFAGDVLSSGLSITAVGVVGLLVVFVGLERKALNDGS